MVDYKFIADVEMNLSLTHHEVEEKCRQEFEQLEKRQKELEDEKRKKWKAEREAQEKQNEEEHARRVQRLEELEAEKIKLELLHKVINDIETNLFPSEDYLNSRSNVNKRVPSQTV